MKQRLNLELAAPDGFRAVLNLEKYTRASVEPTLLHLIKVRASVLNGCAFCIDMHSSDALAAGESSRRLFAVAAWRESPFFSREERAALALTDAATQIADAGVPDAVWEEARQFWSEKEMANLLLAIVTINAWNRIAIATHKLPPPLKARDAATLPEPHVQSA